MKRVLSVIFYLFFVSNLSAQTFKLDTLVFNGISEKRINMVVLGDGYQEAELANFISHAENIALVLLSTPPLSQYKNYFNVFAISVPSNVSGAALNPESLIDNYFGSTFNFAGIERLLVPTRTDKISVVLANNFPMYDQVLMIVNSTKYGGSGGWVATASINESSAPILVHELGHSFSNLADEYWAGSQFAREAPNMTQNSSPSSIIWKNWLNDFGIDIISHAEAPGWFKPHENCKMQFLDGGFCSVCKEQFILSIHNLVSPVNSYSPISADELTDPFTFALDLIKPEPNTLKVGWYLDNEKVHENLDAIDLVLSDLSDGSHELEATIFDGTLLDRHNTVQVTSIVWTLSTSITSSLTSSEIDRSNLDLITSITSEISHFNISAYPNPIQETIIVEYELSRPAQVEITIVNLKGEHITSIVSDKQPQGAYRYEIEASSYNNGLYLLLFKTGNIRQTIKLIKGF